MMIVGIILIGVVVVALVGMGMYNSFVQGKNRIQEAWADIDVQLKRRYDLIPNIIETVKGYASHEQGTFEKVTLLRNQAMNAEKSGDMKASAEAENMLSGTLKSLFALSENYPDLKANTNFLELQRELSDTENKIQAARRFYNSVVRDFNTKVEMFPWNMVAGIFSFSTQELYNLNETTEQRENVKVSF